MKVTAPTAIKIFFRKILGLNPRKAGTIVEQTPKDKFVKVAKDIVYEKPETYVPAEHQKFMWDPEVRNFYWSKTPEGQAERKDLRKLIKERVDLRKTDENT